MSNSQLPVSSLETKEINNVSVDGTVQLESVDLKIEEEDEDDTPLANLPETAFTPVNFSVSNRQILDLYRAWSVDKELDPRPSFQRGYVWDRNRASKLIESILLHVPIPLVYTAEEDDGKEVVIDGQQRLSTCFAFIGGFFPLSRKDEENKKNGENIKQKPFRLGKLKILNHLKNKSYLDLSPELQRQINKYKIQVITISKNSHPDVKFEIFERLNTGSMSLSDQEIRNCIYRGPYNDLINDLAKYPNFQKALNASSDVNKMTDVELILRFLAFFESTYLNYNKKMRSFLNDHMKDRRFVSNELAGKYRSVFENAVDITYSVFGVNSFRRYSDGNASDVSGKWEKAINKAVFDVIMFWFARYEPRQIMPVKDRIRERFIEICSSDREFIDAVTLGTADPARVKTRFEKWGNELKSIINVKSFERRLFSFDEKRKIFDKNQTCMICSQNIETIDDAEVDHIEKYADGGATDLANARLAHRYCNRSRGNK